MSVSNTNRWKLGLFVTAGIALTIAVVMWAGVTQMRRRTFSAYFYFDETVNGLDIGSPVKFRGVVVGHVEEIVPAQDRRHVEVRAGLYVDALGKWGISPIQRLGDDDGGFVSDELRGQLHTSALTQVSFIQIDFFDPMRYPVPDYTFSIPPDTIHTVPSTFKSLETGIMEALDRWPELSRLAQELMTNLNQGILDLELDALSRDVQRALVAAEEVMIDLKSSPLVNRDSAMLKKFEGTLNEITGLVADLRGEGGAVNRVVDRIDRVGEAIQIDFEHSDIPGAVNAVRDAGLGLDNASQELTLLLRELRIGLGNLEATMTSVRELADLLHRDPGALLRGKTPTPLPFRR